MWQEFRAIVFRYLKRLARSKSSESELDDKGKIIEKMMEETLGLKVFAVAICDEENHRIYVSGDDDHIVKLLQDTMKFLLGDEQPPYIH